MKLHVLTIIYKIFESWSSSIKTACQQGCTTCCTQNVTITAVEAEYILNFIRDNHREKWFIDIIDRELPPISPKVTTNEFAEACLNKRDIDPGTGTYDKSCPFLDSGACSIYEARPFSCRSFISTKTCRHNTLATVPHYYISATTAVSQIIEHLGQKEYWGNMLHILYILSRQISVAVGDDRIPNHSRLRFAQQECLTAKPLPGFLISEEDYPYIVPLLERIFDTELGGGKTVEDFLNNK